MNITIIRRALWLVAVLAFGYVVFAYWTWRPAELIIAAGIFVICIPVDILLHGEEIARRSPRHGPVIKWGYHEPAIQAKSPYFHQPRPSLWTRLTPWWMWVLLLAVVPGSAALISAAAAHADPVGDYTIAHAVGFCTTLDRKPTNAGVEDVLGEIHDAGFSPADTAKVIVNSVAVWCPRNQAVLDSFTRDYGTPPAGTVMA